MSGSETVNSTRRRLDGLRGRQLRDEVVRCGLVILGLSGVAIAQPVLDLFGRNPEFFIAGHYRTGQIIWFVVVVTVVPPLVWIAAVALAAIIDRRAGRVVFAAAISVFAFAFTLVLLRTLDVDATPTALTLGVLLAAALTAGLLRTAPLRLFVSYLAAANLLFVTMFLFSSGTAELVTGGDRAAASDGIDMPQPTAPVVFIVFDELPITTLMRPDGTINDARYPGFAELAEVSTWHRNASSAHTQTLEAVPSLLTGKLGDPDKPATYIHHPNNVFSLLSSAMPVDRYEIVTQMCPPQVCEPMPPEPLRQALSDAAVVYGHRALPQSLRDDLPNIDEAWGGFGLDDGGGGGEGDTRTDKQRADDLVLGRWNAARNQGEIEAPSQAAILGQRIAEIESAPALHYSHVMLPHVPWTLSHEGMVSTVELEWSKFFLADPTAPYYEFRRRVFYQMHSQQVGAADALVGELLDQLQQLPNWEDTLLVVTADHGGSFATGDINRAALEDDGIEEGYRVPMFIKAPGQVEGAVRDDVAQSIDVIPTMVELLDIELDDDWEFDGHSLYDGSERTVDPVVSEDVDAALAVARRDAETFPHGDDWLGLAAVGEHGELIGEQVADLDVGQPSVYEVSLDDADLFDDLPTDDGKLPLAITGTAFSPDADPPPELVVAINGRLAGVVGGYRPDGSGWALLGYVADLYKEGSNDVKVYEVTGAGARPTLHEVGQR